MPSAKAPSSSAGATATDFRKPSTSVNHSRTNRMSRSSSVRSTNSCCLSMVISLGAPSASACCPAPFRAAAEDAFVLGILSLCRQVRFALVQVKCHRRRPDRQFRSGRRVTPRRPLIAVRTWWPFPEMILTGYPLGGPGPAARSSTPHRGPSTNWPARFVGEGLGDMVVVVGYLDRLDDDPLAVHRATARVTAERRRDADPRRRGHHHLLETPPAELRRLRRVPVLRAGHTPARSCGSMASTSRSRSARTCGRTAARSPASPTRARVCCLYRTVRRTS